MKKHTYSILPAVIACCLTSFCASAQKNEKLTYDTAGKILYITTELRMVIDTAALYAKKARLVLQRDNLNAKIDSVNAQIKTARKLITGKKGNGNNRAADTPPTPAVAPTTTKPKATTKPKKDGKN